MKIIVAHPAQQHSYRLASALNQKDILQKYITTVYYKPFNYTWLVSMFLRGTLAQKAKLRYMKDVENEKILQFFEIAGLIKLCAMHNKILKRFYSKIKYVTAHLFSKKVAKWAKKNKSDVLICYDDSDAIGFKWLKKYAPNIIRILDVSAVNRLYMKEIYAEDMKKSPDFAKKLNEEIGEVFDQNFLKFWNDEIKNSQYFLVGSEVVKKSLQYSGVNSKNIFICPYGVDTTKFYRKEYKVRMKNEPIRFVFVGGTKQLKGLSYMLEAFQRIDHSKATFAIIGNDNLSNQIKQTYAKDVEFVGMIIHDEIPNVLQNYDVMLFPSLGDGFGLAAVEGLACGLPVIASSNAGISEYIKNGNNGFVVPIQDSEAILNKMEWFIEHRDKIPEMGKNAEKVARELTWDNYYNNVVEAVIKIANNEKLDAENVD